jgi:hypothetical protein
VGILCAGVPWPLECKWNVTSPTLNLIQRERYDLCLKLKTCQRNTKFHFCVNSYMKHKVSGMLKDFDKYADSVYLYTYIHVRRGALAFPFSPTGSLQHNQKTFSWMG